MAICERFKLRFYNSFYSPVGYSRNLTFRALQIQPGSMNIPSNRNTIVYAIIYNSGHCKYHPEPAQFDSNSAMGSYPCCGQKVLRFDPAQPNKVNLSKIPKHILCLFDY